MLVVLASRYDAAALRCVTRWSKWGARLLTCDDLSSQGWCYPVGAAADGTAVIAGKKILGADILAVVTCLAGVPEHEMVNIVPCERAYAAAESHAFLLAWLTELPCPVINRPRAPCLSAPGWRHEQWVNAAARIGIPVAPVLRSVGGANNCTASLPVGSTITVIGPRAIGAADGVCSRWARRLADAAQVQHLAVSFTDSGRGALFLAANPLPDLSNDAVLDALLEYLLEVTATARPVGI